MRLHTLKASVALNGIPNLANGFTVCQMPGQPNNLSGYKKLVDKQKNK